MLNIDKAFYSEGDHVKLKADYETQNQKQTLHIVVFDPSEKEVFSMDQYLDSQKLSCSMVLKFDTKQWKVPGRYRITSWDQDGARKEVFFQFKAKNP